MAQLPVRTRHHGFAQPIVPSEVAVSTDAEALVDHFHLDSTLFLGSGTAGFGEGLFPADLHT